MRDRRSPIAAVAAIAVLALSPAAAGAATDPGSGGGDIYEPWVPGDTNPDPKPKPKPVTIPKQPTPEVVTPPAATTKQPVIVPRTASERAKAKRAVKPAPAVPSLAGVGTNPAPPSPLEAPAVGAIALACLGSAWLLRPRRA